MKTCLNCNEPKEEISKWNIKYSSPNMLSDDGVINTWHDGVNMEQVLLRFET